MPISFDEIKRVIDLAARSEVAALEVTHEGMRVRVETNAVQSPMPQTVPALMPTPSAQAADTIPVDASPASVVRAPTDGVIYFRHAPGAEAFITAGTSVEPGQTLCLIEVMKLLYPVIAPKAGTIGRILVEDGSQVAYDEVLLELA